MTHQLSDDDIARIADATARQIKHVSDVDAVIHAEHHTWIEKQREDERERHEFRVRVIHSSLAWALPIAISFVCLAVWRSFASAIHASSGAG